MSTAQQQPDGAAAQAQEKAQEVAGQAKEQAQQAAGQAKQQVRTQVDQRSTQAGQQITEQASDIRTVGQKLREEGKDKPAKVADQAAERIERVGSYLEHSDADRILSDVEDFARQRPWAVVAGGMFAGFLASRFLKASQSDRFQQRQTGTYARPAYGTASTPSTPATPALGGTGTGVPAGVGNGGNELSSGVGAPTTPGVPEPRTVPSAHPATGAR